MEVAQFFEEISNLPNIPKVVQELIESFNDEDVDTLVLAGKIAMDQTLTAKVLRMANSVYYGPSRTVTTVNDAVISIGVNALRTLVLASGVKGAFESPADFDVKHFWQVSFKVAAVAKELAKSVAADPETAFTCGMLHNVGEVLLHLGAPAKALKIDEAVKFGGNRIALQASQIGVTYTQLGAELANQWRFPDVISLAVAGQANPLAEKEFCVYAALLHIAQFLVISQDNKFSEDDIRARFPVEVAKKIDLDELMLLQRLDEIAELGHEFDEML